MLTKIAMLNRNVLGYDTNINFERDITLTPFLYPLYILTANRMVDSPISRANEKRKIRIPVINGL